jgi:hypothetical protein
MLRYIKRSLNFANEQHVVLWAGLTLGFFFLLRAGEYCRTSDHFDPTRGLLVWKLLGEVDGATSEDYEQAVALTMLFEVCKTDQNKVGCTRTVYETGDDLCPVDAVRLLRRMRGANWRSKDPVLMTNGGWILTRAYLSAALDAAAADLGLPPGSLASHSLRIGGATALHAAGQTDEAIRRFGRWLSDCWRRYVYSNRHEVCDLSSQMARAHVAVQFSANDFKREVFPGVEDL